MQIHTHIQLCASFQQKNIGARATRVAFNQINRILHINYDND